MEFFDILDEQGNKTGEIKARSLVHRDGDWHRSVHVWIVDGRGRILMQRRSADKDSYPNCWGVSCSGHLLAGDTSIMTVIKELKEELGLDVLEGKLKFLFQLESRLVQNEGSFFDNEFNDVYLIEMDELDTDELKLQTEEVSEVKWVTAEELASVVENNTLGYIPQKEEYKKIIEYVKRNRSSGN